MTNFLFKHKPPELMQGKDAPASVRDKVGYLMLNRLGWMAEQRVGRNRQGQDQTFRNIHIAKKSLNDTINFELVFDLTIRSPNY